MPLTNEILDFKGIPNKVNFTSPGLGYMAVGQDEMIVLE